MLTCLMCMRLGKVKQLAISTKALYALASVVPNEEVPVKDIDCPACKGSGVFLGLEED